MSYLVLLLLWAFLPSDDWVDDDIWGVPDAVRQEAQVRYARANHAACYDLGEWGRLDALRREQPREWATALRGLVANERCWVTVDSMPVTVVRRQGAVLQVRVPSSKALWWIGAGAVW